jgi:hypothetical protein
VPRRVGLPTALLVVLALTLPSAALAISLFVEGEGSGLTVVVQPPGAGVVTGPGIYCEDECSYEIAGAVTLTAIANPGYAFKSWGHCDTGGVNGRHCTVTALGQSISAKFVKTQELTVAKAEGSGSGKVSSSPGGILCLASCTSTKAVFLQSTKVKLTQVPAKHFHFVEWLGGCTGSGPCELLMGEDHEVEALFAEDPKHTLTLTKAGDGLGVVKSKPAGIACLYTCTSSKAHFYGGEAVVLEAVPGKGSTFEGWYGDGCSGTGACAITMNQAREVGAQFGPPFEGPLHPPGEVFPVSVSR